MYEVKPLTGSLFEADKANIDFSGNMKIDDIDFIITGKNEKFEDGTPNIKIKGNQKIGDGSRVHGYLKANTNRASDKHPDWKGKITLFYGEEKTDYFLSAWENKTQVKQERYLKLKLKKIEPREEPKPEDSFDSNSLDFN